MQLSSNGIHRNARAIIESLPILAAVMAEDAGTRVQFAQDVHTGMTDGKVITLPVVPLPNPAATPQELEKLATYYFGLEDHEIGHCRVSDLPALSKRIMKSKPIVKGLFNAIEDVRMEIEHGIDYPGADRNMRKLSTQLVDEKHDNPIQEATPPGQAIPSWICHFLRFAVHEEACYQTHAEQGEITLRGLVGDTAVDRMKGYLAQAPFLQSSEQALDLSMAIAQAIEEEAKQPPNSPPPPSGQTSPNPGNGQGEKQGQASSQDQTEALKQATESADVFADRGDAVREILAQAVKKMVKQGHAKAGATIQVPSAAAGVGDSDPDLTPTESIDIETVKGVSARARTRLTALLQAETREVSRLAKRGQVIDCRQLHRLRANDPRIFLQVQDERNLDTALFLLLDVSGSMKGDPIKIAREAMLATAMATDMLTGVSLATGTFPGYQLIQPFGMKAKVAARRYGVDATGATTPMAEGMLWAGKHLARRSEARKLLVVATDGQPASAPAAIAAVRTLAATGVEVLGYGIDEDITHVIPNSRTLNSVDQLPGALMAMLHDVLRPLKAA